jgi:hypothetical protein
MLRKGKPPREEPVRERDIDLVDILAAIRQQASSLEDTCEPFGAGERDGAAAQPREAAAQMAPSDSASATRASPAAAARSQTSRIPTVAASPYVNTEAGERVRRLEEERRRQAGAGHAIEDAEATVSFVVRSAGRS